MQDQTKSTKSIINAGSVKAGNSKSVHAKLRFFAFLLKKENDFEHF